MSATKSDNKKRTEFFRETRHPWFQGTENFVELEHADGLVDHVVKTHGPANARQAWVLDLDSTLFCTGPRNREIYRAFIDFRVDAPAHWKQALENLSPTQQSFNIRESLEWALKHIDEKTAHAESKKIWQDFNLFWEQHFFSSTYMHHDIPYEGAVEFVNRVWNLGYSVVYVTGRDTVRSLEGTLDSLRQWKFPMHERTELILKPGFRWSMSDVEFKQQASAKIAQKYEVLCSVDNEPENLHAFARYFPKSEIVLFHSVMSERTPETSIKPHLDARNLWLLKNF